MWYENDAGSEPSEEEKDHQRTNTIVHDERRVVTFEYAKETSVVVGQWLDGRVRLGSERCFHWIRLFDRRLATKPVPAVAIGLLGSEQLQAAEHVRTVVHRSFVIECNETDEDRDLKEKVDQHGHGCVETEETHGRHRRESAEKERHTLRDGCQEHGGTHTADDAAHLRFDIFARQSDITLKRLRQNEDIICTGREG